MVPVARAAGKFWNSRKIGKNECYDISSYPYACTVKCLGAVDDQVAKSLAGADEFSDDHADKAQPNIDFHHT